VAPVAVEIRSAVPAVSVTSSKHFLVAVRHSVAVSAGQAAHLADKILKPLLISLLKKRYLVVKQQSKCARLCAVMTARDPAHKKAQHRQRVLNVVALAKCDECDKACLVKWLHRKHVADAAEWGKSLRLRAQVVAVKVES
jgi:hypothetical protein